MKARIQCVREDVRQGVREASGPGGSRASVCDSAGMSIFDDLWAEQERLEKILSGLD